MVTGERRRAGKVPAPKHILFWSVSTCIFLWIFINIFNTFLLSKGGCGTVTVGGGPVAVGSNARGRAGIFLAAAQGISVWSVCM